MNNENIPNFWEVNFFQLTIYGWAVLFLALLATLLGGALVVVAGFAVFMLLNSPSTKFGMGIAVLGLAAACGSGQWAYRFG